MEPIQITAEQFRQALAWINGQASTLGEKEVLDMLRTLTNGFRENCRNLRPGPIPRFRSLSRSPLALSALIAETEFPESDSAPTENIVLPVQTELQTYESSAVPVVAEMITPEQVVADVVKEFNPVKELWR